MTTFIKFEDLGLGLGLAAVFYCCGKEVRLCQEPLKQRIDNLKDQGLPCDVEMAALAEMNHRLTNFTA